MLAPSRGKQDGLHHGLSGLFSSYNNMISYQEQEYELKRVDKLFASTEFAKSLRSQLRMFKRIIINLHSLGIWSLSRLDEILCTTSLYRMYGYGLRTFVISNLIIRYLPKFIFNNKSISRRCCTSKR